MTRPLPLNLGLTLSVLALAACGETTTPTQAGTAGDESLATTSLAWPSDSWTAVAPMPEQLWRFELAAGVTLSNPLALSTPRRAISTRHSRRVRRTVLAAGFEGVEGLEPS